MAGNLIGLSVNGAGQLYTSGMGNGANGITIYNASNNWVGVNPVYGSETSDQRNVISGSQFGVGVQLQQRASSNVVAGNLIGTGPGGVGREGNGIGILVEGGTGNRIGNSGQDGADDAIEGNIVAGNAWDGVEIWSGSTDNVVAGNLIGVDANGNADGNGWELTSDFIAGLGNGVSIYDSSGNWVGVNPVYGPENADQRNVISANFAAGVSLQLASSSNNVIAGNLIGTDPTGTKSLGEDIGISILGGSSSNRIGTSGQDGADDAIEGNVIAGNGAGVEMSGFGTTGNVVAGNLVGLNVDANGSSLSNLDNTTGISIDQLASGNWIGVNPVYGSENADQRNVISDNFVGVNIASSGNVVAGNDIGTNVQGTGSLSNYVGVDVTESASNNRIGTSGQDGLADTLEANIISGNASSGIQLNGSGATGNVIAGNRIGTNAAGDAPLGNGSGIDLEAGASGNWIGVNPVYGPENADERNVISGNLNRGVELDSPSSNTVIAGNFVGTDALGDAAIPNHSDGIWVTGANNRIGTTGQDGTDDALEGNLVSGNGGTGIHVYGSGATGNVIAGNRVGTNAAGAAPLGNGYEGISLQTGPSGNWIGVNPVYGPENADQGNLISGNAASGVGIYCSNDVIAGNSVGTDATGEVAIPNGLNAYGIDVSGANNRIGTTGQDGADDALEANVISGNGAGIRLFGSASTGNVIAGNRIGTDAAGEAPLGNTYDGILFLAGADGNWIGINPVYGPENADQRNVISGNSRGVEIDNPSANNVIAGNFVGTDALGDAAIPNHLEGLRITGADNRVGTTGQDGADDALEANVISGNDAAGIHLYGSGATGNVIAGNRIGTDAAGDAALGNGYDGIQGDVGADGNWIGVNPVYGPENADQGNLISGNKSCGVELDGPNWNNVIAGNDVGTDASGSCAIENAAWGIALFGDNADDTVIGLPGAGNLISAGNLYPAITMWGASGTVIQANKIGTTADGMSLLPGQLLGGGIFVANSPDTQIGGTAPGTGNLISTGPWSSAYLPDNTPIGGFPWIFDGIDIASEFSSNTGCAGTVVEGNLIGTDATGDAVLGNPTFGIGLIDISDITIGGTSAAAANVIAGNNEGGIAILSGPYPYPGIISDQGSSDNLIEGNLIGINFDANGNPIAGLGNGSPIPGFGNVEAGIYINDPADPNQTSTGNTIGGTAAGAGNIIANNYGPGVAVAGANAFDESILGNAIYGNSGLGIDLGDGVTPDTPGGPHAGPNDLQNFPVPTSATSDATGTTIQGSFNSTPNTTFTLQFFANDVPDPTGFGQGQQFLGSVSISTDGNGNASFTATFATPVPSGQDIAATATDANGNTSEFSLSVGVNTTQVTLAVNPSTVGTDLQNAVSTLQSAATGTTSPMPSIDLAVDPTTLNSVSNAIAGLAANSSASTNPIPIVLNLAPGTYSDTVISAPAGVQVTINGGNGNVTVVGNSPAFVVNAGNVLVENLTFTTVTNSPTIVVNGGSLVIRYCTIQESTGYTQAAILINGGTVDLGTVAGPGGNTLNVNGTGTLIQDANDSPVPAVGDTFEINGATAPSIFVLNPTANGALSLSGNAAINILGAVVVDSSSSSAISAGGSSQITASTIEVGGGSSRSGNATFSITPATGLSAPDPLAGLALPPAPAGIPATVNLTSGSLTISQGVYKQIKVSGNSTLKLSPGTYIIEGGGLSVSGGASISGSGVLIVNGGSNYPSPGGPYGSITLSGNGSYNLTPSTSGTYAGIVVFQTPDNTKAMTVSGNASGMTGTIYAPAAPLTESGNALLNAALIVDTLSISGSGVANALTLDSPSGTVAYTPAQIRAAYGINAPGAGRYRPDHRHRRRLRRSGHLRGARRLRLPVRTDRLRTDAVRAVRSGLVVPDRPQPVRPGHVPAFDRPERARLQ